MTVSNTNFFQPTGFRLVIDRENYPNLEFFVNSVMHPSVSSMSADNPSFRRVQSVPMPGDKLEFSEVTFDLMLDEEFAAYNEVYNWMQRIVEKKYTTQTQATTALPSSEADITLLMLNSNNNQEKKFVYRNAFPTNLGDLSMAANQGGAEPIFFPVSFRYTYFEVV